MRYDSKVSAEERYLCLVMALLTTNSGMSKSEIFQNVRGYRETYTAQGSTVALEKVFERDKETIRSIGFPLSDNESENPADIRYFIKQEEYGMADFTATEVNILNNASAIWHQSSLSDDAKASARRMAALDVSSSMDYVGYAPRVTTHDPAFPVLKDLMSEGKAVTFRYLKPGHTTADVRTVSGLALIQFEGHWMLHGFDHDRQATRNFLLQRMVSLPHSVGSAQVQAGNEHSGIALDQLHDLWEKTTALIDVVPGSEADVVLLNRRSTRALSETVREVHFVDEAIFADELCAFGPDIVVLSPESLRSSVIHRLSTLEALHG